MTNKIETTPYQLDKFEKRIRKETIAEVEKLIDKLNIKAEISQRGQYKRGMQFIIEQLKSKLQEMKDDKV